MNLRAVVRHYEQHFRARARAELASFASEPTLRAAVLRAAFAVAIDGKRYPHQRRLSLDDLALAAQRLVASVGELDRAPDFTALLELVRRRVGHFAGLGELYLYDTALRIGAKKGTLPRRVYLHSGAREGAAALGLDIDGAVGLFKVEVPVELRELECHEIEDVLCIYQRYFTGEEPRLDTVCARGGALAPALEATAPAAPVEDPGAHPAPPRPRWIARRRRWQDGAHGRPRHRRQPLHGPGAGLAPPARGAPCHAPEPRPGRRPVRRSRRAAARRPRHR